MLERDLQLMAGTRTVVVLKHATILAPSGT